MDFLFLFLILSVHLKRFMKSNVKIRMEWCTYAKTINKRIIMLFYFTMLPILILLYEHPFL